MVTITGYKTNKNKEGKEFNILEISGAVEMIQSTKTGKFYAHAYKATITTTLNESSCKALIGTQFPGIIKKVACDPYNYEVPGTNDILTLNHSFQYFTDNSNKVEETIFSGEIV